MLSLVVRCSRACAIGDARIKMSSIRLSEKKELPRDICNRQIIARTYDVVASILRRYVNCYASDEMPWQNCNQNTRALFEAFNIHF